MIGKMRGTADSPAYESFAAAAEGGGIVTFGNFLMVVNDYYLATGASHCRTVFNGLMVHKHDGEKAGKAVSPQKLQKAAAAERDSGRAAAADRGQGGLEPTTSLPGQMP